MTFNVHVFLFPDIYNDTSFHHLSYAYKLYFVAQIVK